MKIKTELINPIEYYERDEFGDLKEKLKIIEVIEDKNEFDFTCDEIVQMEKTINPINIIPQESLRYSIINILAYCLGNIINDYMIKYTQHSNSYAEGKKCLIIMKNEFLFKRVLLMNHAKKNYASIQEIQEGNMVASNAGLDIKGLAMTKSGTNKTTQDRLKSILYEDILNAENVDQVKVLKELAKFEKEIYNSLQNGEKTFYKPARIKSVNSYDNPMRIQGVKGAIVWNSLRDEELEPFDLDIRNSLDILKIDITPKNIEKLRLINENAYNKAIDLMKQKEFSTGIQSISIPKNVKVPKWMTEYINYTTIINDNLKVFPLDPIGVYTMSDNNNYTNILKI